MPYVKKLFENWEHSVANSGTSLERDSLATSTGELKSQVSRVPRQVSVQSQFACSRDFSVVNNFGANSKVRCDGIETEPADPGRNPFNGVFGSRRVFHHFSTVS